MERVPINACWFQELSAVPGVGLVNAGHIIELREAHGAVTPELLLSLPLARPERLLEAFDFRPSAWTLFRAQPSSPLTPHSYIVQEGRCTATPILGNRARAQVDEGLGYTFNTSPSSPPRSNHVTPAQRTRVPGEQLGCSPASRGFGNPTLGMERDYLDNPGEDEEFSHRYRRRAFTDIQEAQTNIRPEPQSMPKTISYDGVGSWHAFYAKFRAFASECKWTVKECKNQLLWCLEGKASEFFTLLVDRYPRAEYYDLINRMERRFGYEELPEAIQLEFAYARQNSGEQVLDWADRVTHLATLSFPDLPEEHLQKQIVLKFCQGCADKDAGHHALKSRPSTLDIAVDQVKWHHHTQRAMFARSRQDARYVQAVTGYVAAPASQVGLRRNSVTRTEAGFSSPDVSQRLGQLESQMAKLSTAIENLTSTMGSARKPDRSPCSGCGLIGHHPRECPKQSVGQRINDEASNCSGSDDQEADPRPALH